MNMRSSINILIGQRSIQYFISCQKLMMSLAAPAAVIILLCTSAFSMTSDPAELAKDRPADASKAAGRSTPSKLLRIPQAHASISGRASTPEGRSITNATVFLIDEFGNLRRVTTNSFGIFSLSRIETGRMYMLFITHKHYAFAFPSQMFEVTEDISGLQIVGESSW